MQSTLVQSSTEAFRRTSGRLVGNYQATAVSQSPVTTTGWRRAVYLLLAAITFACSIVGVVLPGIPTTPFLLLTSYCLVRSSKRLHNRLLRSRMFGDLLINWQEHRRIRRSTRNKALVLTLTIIATSLLFGGFSGVLLLAMVCGAGVGIAVILSLPVLEDRLAVCEQ